MNILVTGWAGYIGTPVVRALQAQGHKVLGLDTGWFRDQAAEPLATPDLDAIGDIRDRVEATRIDAVVHLAGLSNDPMGDLDPELTDDINRWGTLSVFASYPNARHVFASSCSVYGATKGYAFEGSPVQPQTPYAMAKARVDAVLGNDAANSVSLRFGTAYGWAPAYRLDLSVNRMAYDATRGGVQCTSPHAWRPFTHVEDIASAVALMVESDAIDIFNVVGENLNIGDLACMFPGPVTIADNGDRRNYRANGDRLRRLGWEPRHTVEGTIPELLARELPPREYRRLQALQALRDAGTLDRDLRTTKRVREADLSISAAL